MAKPRKGYRFRDQSRKDQEIIREFMRYLDSIKKKKK